MITSIRPVLGSVKLLVVGLILFTNLAQAQCLIYKDQRMKTTPVLHIIDNVIYLGDEDTLGQTYSIAHLEKNRVYQGKTRRDYPIAHIDGDKIYSGETGYSDAFGSVHGDVIFEEGDTSFKAARSHGCSAIQTAAGGAVYLKILKNN